MMSQNPPNTKPQVTLREQAERRLRALPEVSEDTSTESIVELVHDLRTHQIELEMQNEELRNAQVALIDSRDAFADLYDFAPLGYVTCDERGLVVQANLTLVDWLGTERSSFVAQPFSAFIIDEDQDVYYQLRHRLLEGRTPPSGELRLRRQGDDALWARLDGVVTKSSADDTIELRFAIADIAERKDVEADRNKLERELHHAQKMNAVGQLASGIAHEFNNLLFGIRGNAELLLHKSADRLTERDHSKLSAIVQAGDRAHTLTKQLLSFARKRNSNTTVFDVNQQLAEGRRMFEKPIGSRIALKIAASADPAIISADEAEIGQVILNLVLNARDAIPDKGTITIQTRIVTLRDDDVPQDRTTGQYVILSVADDGTGMSPETRERIFEPFFTTKDVGEGTGLGLSVVHADIAKNGGFTTVDSNKGTGTVISIFLPRAAVALPQEPAEDLDASQVLIGGNETILVCDDDDLVLNALKALLEQAGYAVIATESAADALAAAELHSQKIDLLLTDVTMPGMDGVELGRQIHLRHPTMRILYLSGYSAHHVGGCNAADMLMKGTPIGEFLQRIRDELDSENSSASDV